MHNLNMQIIAFRIPTSYLTFFALSQVSTFITKGDKVGQVGDRGNWYRYTTSFFQSFFNTFVSLPQEEQAQHEQIRAMVHLRRKKPRMATIAWAIDGMQEQSPNIVSMRAHPDDS
jgi:hypothetical protein